MIRIRVAFWDRVPLPEQEVGALARFTGRIRTGEAHVTKPLTEPWPPLIF
ncbi:hypothetical protein RM704_06680 [Streptomyces sp. DSM 3412]|uniref:Uncharacterized protein n=1 Tax=Streptomyces gottesmaniae TaxID=3075518 RepID=A0ABU2YSC6_9ACTN|nr:hypothetical protein [Streptomyces sp. DSM 3412]MDT0567151.1 hypothetical protein [Streptomyces sp. DSM 3412]